MLRNTARAPARRCASALRDRRARPARRPHGWWRSARPNSTTGQASLMKRASDVPPLVESAGRRPVTSSTACGDEIGEGAARGQEGDRVGRIEGQRRGAPRRPRRSARAISACSVSGRPEIVEADVEDEPASAGITLEAGLPTSTVMTSRFDGSKSRVPASSGGSSSAVEHGRERRASGLSARCG